MTGVRIDIEEAAVSAALARLSQTAQSPAPLLDEIGAQLVTNTRFRFGTGTAPGGGRWRPSFRAREVNGQTLVASGRLRDSITHRVAGSVLEVGSDVRYAAVHQFGATIRAKSSKGLRFRIGKRWATKKSVSIPARPFLGLDAGDRADIADVIADHFRRIANAG